LGAEVFGQQILVFACQSEIFDLIIFDGLSREFSRNENLLGVFRMILQLNFAFHEQASTFMWNKFM